MILDLTQLVLLGILCASVHWLVARSEIAKPFWAYRGHPIWFSKLLACAGCSGWWLGALFGVTSFVAPVGFITGTSNTPTWLSLGLLVAQTFVTAVLGVFVTPIFESALLWGLSASALQDSVDGDTPEPAPDTGSVPEHMRTSDSALVTPVDSPIRRKTT